MLSFEKFAIIQGIATVCLAALAYAIRWANERKSAKDRFVGWWIFALVVAGFFAAGVFAYARWQHIYFINSSCFGALFGLAAGHVIGRLVWRFYAKEIESDTDEGGIES